MVFAPHCQLKVSTSSKCPEHQNYSLGCLKELRQSLEALLDRNDKDVFSRVYGLQT